MRLVEALVYARIATQVLAVSLGVIFVGMLAYNLSRPVPPLAVIFNPNYACGKIDPVQLPKGVDADYSQADVQINTKSETMRFIPPIAYVYRIRYKGETFSLRERLFSVAHTLGFEQSKYTKPEPYLFRWEDYRRVLVADSRTGSFGYTFKREVLVNLEKGQLKFVDDAKPVAMRVLNMLGLLTGFEGVEVGTISPYIYSSRVNDFVKVDSISEASVVRVGFITTKPLLVFDLRYYSPKYRQDLDLSKIDFLAFYRQRDQLDPEYTKIFNVPTVGDHPYKGNPEIYVASDQGDLFRDSVAKIVYNNWDIVDEPCGTYPIKDANSIVQDIQKEPNKAKLVYLAPFGGDEYQTPSKVKIVTINITDVGLAYYAPGSQSGYLQPIYLLKGSGYDDKGTRYNMTFYVDAMLHHK